MAFEVDGAAIMVDAAARDRIRMQLAAKGLPAGGPAGYEILDTSRASAPPARCSTPPTGAPRRASSPAPSSAPPASRRAGAPRHPGVDAVLAGTPRPPPRSPSPRRAARSTRGRAEAIRYLVASAVAGMTPENVAVIDAAAGVILARQGGPADRGRRRPGPRPARERAAAARGARRPGKAVVEVNVETVTESQTISERAHRPREPGGDQLGDRGELGERDRAARRASPSPATCPTATWRGRRRRPGARRTRARSGRTSRSARPGARWSVPGAIRKVSVAVMVDGIAGPARRQRGLGAAAGRGDGDAAPAGRARRSASTRRAATRSRSSRWSSARSPEQGTLAESTGSGFLEIWGGRLAQLGVLGAIVLALILFVIRPMTARRPVPGAGRADRSARDRRRPRHAAPPQIRSDVLLDLPAQTVGKIERLRDVISEPGRGQRRGAPELDRSRPTAARSQPDHERLSPRDLPARRGARGDARRPAARRLDAVREQAYTEGYLDGQAVGHRRVPRGAGPRWRPS